MASSSDDYSAVLTSLLPPACPHHFLSLPVSPRKPHIPSHRISSLSLHPVIESILHLLNMDLPSAHFLLRHMQAAPATEAMYIHGILHRIEGDLDNTRAWYGDVKSSEVFQAVWTGMDSEDGGRPPSVTARASDQEPQALDGHTRNNSDQSIETSGQTTPSAEAFDSAMSFVDQVESYKVNSLSSASRPKQDSAKSVVPEEETLAEVSLRELRRVLSFCAGKFGTESVADASNVWVAMNEKHADKAAEDRKSVV